MRDLDDLFDEELVSRLESSRKKRVADNPFVIIKGGNPVCGDRVEYDIELDGNVVKDVTFRCKGCFMSGAGADIAAECVVGKTIDEALAMTSAQVLEELKSVVGIRERCALVGFETIQHALKVIRSHKRSNTSVDDKKTFIPIELEFRV